MGCIHTQRYREDSIKHLQELFQHGIWGGEDKCTARTHLFCPLLVFNMLQTTFCDEAIFTQTLMEPEEATGIIKQSLPADIKKACAWAFRHSEQKEPVYLPEAFVLPKAKKSFQKARPLIPATGHWLKKLHTVTSRIIGDLAHERYGAKSLNVGTTMDAVKILRCFLERHQSGLEGKLVALNRDLAGFYTAIPQSDILRAVDELLDSFSKPFGEAWWTSSLAKTRPITKKGKLHTKGSIRLEARTIKAIVRHALQSAFFTIGGRVFRQSRGALMGYPLSGILCILTIMRLEELNVPQRAIPMRDRDWIALRYVDNLLAIYQRIDDEPTLPEWLQSSSCYGSSIILEHETTLDYLGLTLLPTAFSFHLAMIVPGFDELGLHDGRLWSQKWRYRSAVGATNRAAVVGGIEARLHNAIRFTYPLIQTHIAIAKLMAIANAVEFSQEALVRLTNKFAGRYPSKFTPAFFRNLRAAIAVAPQKRASALLELIGCLSHSIPL